MSRVKRNCRTVGVSGSGARREGGREGGMRQSEGKERVPDSLISNVRQQKWLIAQQQVSDDREVGRAYKASDKFTEA